MQPRYGKNYCLIPKVAAGETTVDILYQQNLYPPQTFSFKVPENGHIGFLLTKHNNEYQLYDIEGKYYIPDIKTKQDHW